MANQKTAATPFWAILLIAFVIFSQSSTAFKFPSLSTNPKKVSALSRRLQSSLVSDQPAISPSMPPMPSLQPFFMPPVAAILPIPPFPQQSSPQPAMPSPPTSMPPVPSQLPIASPPQSSPVSADQPAMPSMPTFMPPAPSQLPYPTPPSPPMSSQN